VIMGWPGGADGADVLGWSSGGAAGGGAGGPVPATGVGAPWSAVEAGDGGAGVTEAAAGAEEVRRDVVASGLAPPGGAEAGPRRGCSATGTCSMTVVGGGQSWASPAVPGETETQVRRRQHVVR